MGVAPSDCSLDDRPIQRGNDVICFGAPRGNLSGTQHPMVDRSIPTVISLAFACHLVRITARHGSHTLRRSLTHESADLKMNRSTPAYWNDRPDHLALSHRRETWRRRDGCGLQGRGYRSWRSEEHTSELQSRGLNS